VDALRSRPWLLTPTEGGKACQIRAKTFPGFIQLLESKRQSPVDDKLCTLIVELAAHTARVGLQSFDNLLLTRVGVRGGIF
jgi:hypothetical protein